MSERRAAGGRAASVWDTTSVVVAVACVLTLALGFLVKDRCVGSVVPSPVSYDGRQYTQACYSDVFVLYYARNLARAPVPYVDGDGRLGNNVGPDGARTEIGDLEYPAGTGLFVALAALLADGSGQTFFALTAIVLALAGIGAVMVLLRMVEDRRRLLYFAAAPTVVLYAFHNWDLIAVFLFCAALYAFWSRSASGAGAFTGLGAAAKVFPGTLVVAFAASLWRTDRARALRIAAAAAGAFLAINLPFAVINRAGWWMPWDFQSERFPNYETSWFFLHKHLLDRWFSHEAYGAFTALASGALFLVAVVLLVRSEWRRPEVRPYALVSGLVIAFLLTTKVFSPQFALWVLPVFVLVRVPWWSFAAFAVTEAATWFAIAGFIVWLQYPDAQHAGSPSSWLALVEIAVWARYAALGLLLWRTRVDPENVAQKNHA